MSLHDRIKEARKKRGLTQEQLGSLIGVAKTTITGYEKNREPTAAKLGEIADALGVDVNFLYQDEVKEFHNNRATIEEMEKLVKPYRSLDSHGREIVDFILTKETNRVKELEKESTSEVVPMRPMSYYQKMASAGSGEYLFNDIPTVVIEVPDTPLSRRADFVLGVNGRSMENTFFDGDKVLVKKTPDVLVGEIGVFIRGGDCFIKEAGEDRLISHNEDKEIYPDIIPDERGIITVGIVLGKVGD